MTALPGNVLSMPSAPLGQLLISVHCPHLPPQCLIMPGTIQGQGVFFPLSQRRACRLERLVRGKVKCCGMGRRRVLSPTVIRYTPKSGAGEGCVNKPIQALRANWVFGDLQVQPCQFTERERDSPKDAQPSWQGRTAW